MKLSVEKIDEYMPPFQQNGPPLSKEDYDARLKEWVEQDKNRRKERSNFLLAIEKVSKWKEESGGGLLSIPKDKPKAGISWDAIAQIAKKPGYVSTGIRKPKSLADLEVLRHVYPQNELNKVIKIYRDNPKDFPKDMHSIVLECVFGLYHCYIKPYFKKFPSLKATDLQGTDIWVRQRRKDKIHAEGDKEFFEFLVELAKDLEEFVFHPNDRIVLNLYRLMLNYGIGQDEIAKIVMKMFSHNEWNQTFEASHLQYSKEKKLFSDVASYFAYEAMDRQYVALKEERGFLSDLTTIVGDTIIANNEKKEDTLQEAAKAVFSYLWSHMNVNKDIQNTAILSVISKLSDLPDQKRIAMQIEKIAIKNSSEIPKEEIDGKNLKELFHDYGQKMDKWLDQVVRGGYVYREYNEFNEKVRSELDDLNRILESSGLSAAKENVQYWMLYSDLPNKILRLACYTNSVLRRQTVRRMLYIASFGAQTEKYCGLLLNVQKVEGLLKTVYKKYPVEVLDFLLLLSSRAPRLLQDNYTIISRLQKEYTEFADKKKIFDKNQTDRAQNLLIAAKFMQLFMYCMGNMIFVQDFIEKVVYFRDLVKVIDQVEKDPNLDMTITGLESSLDPMNLTGEKPQAISPLNFLLYYLMAFNMASIHGISAKNRPGLSGIKLEKLFGKLKLHNLYRLISADFSIIQNQQSLYLKPTADEKWLAEYLEKSFKELDFFERIDDKLARVIDTDAHWKYYVNNCFLPHILEIMRIIPWTTYQNYAKLTNKILEYTKVATIAELETKKDEEKCRMLDIYITLNARTQMGAVATPAEPQKKKDKKDKKSDQERVLDGLCEYEKTFQDAVFDIDVDKQICGLISYLMEGERRENQHLSELCTKVLILLLSQSKSAFFQREIKKQGSKNKLFYIDIVTMLKEKANDVNSFVSLKSTFWEESMKNASALAKLCRLLCEENAKPIKNIFYLEKMPDTSKTLFLTLMDIYTSLPGINAFAEKRQRELSINFKEMLVELLIGYNDAESMAVLKLAPKWDALLDAANADLKNIEDPDDLAHELQCELEIIQRSYEACSLDAFRQYVDQVIITKGEELLKSLLKKAGKEGPQLTSESLITAYRTEIEFNSSAWLKVLFKAYQVLVIFRETSPTWHDNFRHMGIRGKTRSQRDEISITELINFLKEVVRSLEYVDFEGKIKTIYFAKLPQCYFMREKNMERVLESYDAVHPTGLHDFVVRNIELLWDFTKVSYNQYVKRNFFSCIVFSNDIYVKILVQALSLTINAIIFFSSRKSEIHVNKWAVFEILFSIIAVVMWYYMEYDEELKLDESRRKVDKGGFKKAPKYLNPIESTYKAGKKAVKEVWRRCWTFLNQTTTQFFGLHIVSCLLGMAVNEMFFSISLLAVIYFSRDLRYVVKSVVLHGDQLLLTGFLTFLIMIIYSIFSYYLFSDLFKDIRDEEGKLVSQACDSAMSCLITVVNLAFRNGSGIGDITQPIPYFGSYFWGKFICDISFFILINTMSISLIFGIISNTFDELRAISSKIDYGLNNTCIVCNVDKADILKANIDFGDHCKHSHNIENYLFYFFSLLHVGDEKELNACDLEVYRKLKVGDISFFPLDRIDQNLKTATQEQVDLLGINLNMRLSLLENALTKVCEDMKTTGFDYNKLKETLLTAAQVPSAPAQPVKPEHVAPSPAKVPAKDNVKAAKDLEELKKKEDEKLREKERRDREADRFALAPILLPTTARIMESTMPLCGKCKKQMEFTNLPSFYGNTWGCDICGKEFENKPDVKAYHCSKDNYDVCKSCGDKAKQTLQKIQTGLMVTGIEDKPTYKIGTEHGDNTDKFNDAEDIRLQAKLFKISKITVFFDDSCVYGLQIAYQIQGEGEIIGEAHKGNNDRYGCKKKTFTLENDEFLVGVRAIVGEIYHGMEFMTSKNKKSPWYGGKDNEAQISSLEAPRFEHFYCLSGGIGGHLHFTEWATTNIPRTALAKKETLKLQSRPSLIPSQTLSHGKTLADTKVFDDVKLLKLKAERVKITRIHVHHNERFVFGMEVFYEGPNGEVSSGRHKGGNAHDECEESVIYFDDDEFLTKISGNSGDVIYCIKFESSKDNKHTFGGPGGADFSLAPPQGHHFSILSQGVGNQLHNITAITAPIRMPGEEDDSFYGGDEETLSVVEVKPMKVFCGRCPNKQLDKQTSVYRNNMYSCNICKQLKSASDLAPVYHCKTCDWDVCPDCQAK